MQRSVRADRQERQAREHHCLDRDEVAAKPMTVHQRYRAFRHRGEGLKNQKMRNNPIHSGKYCELRLISCPEMC
jgi:hypothetical protein